MHVEMRYVAWPRDQLRTIVLHEGKWQRDQLGVTISVTDRTDIIVPWHNIVDIVFVK
jgi:hypothetical protein